MTKAAENQGGELSAFPSQQLYNELWDRHYGNVVMWTDEDVKRLWCKETGTYPDADEIQDVWAHIGDTLRDRMVQAGWEILAEAVSEITW